MPRTPIAETTAELRAPECLARRATRAGTVTSLLAALVAGACGGGASSSAGPRSADTGFVCNDRRAEYLLVGSFAAAELGMAMSCEGGTPTLTKWYVEDGASDRQSESFDIYPAEFERLWQQLEDAGWRNLEDCLNENAGDDEQIATFDITDGDSTVSLTCQGKQQPFPFDRLANAFDELGRGYNAR